MYNESQREQTRANDAAQIRSQQCEPTDDNWRRNITFASNENEFRGPLAHNLATMPLEQLSDMTPPNWETTTMTTTADASTTQPNSYVDSLYQEIVNRFDELRRCIARGDNQQQQLPHDACDVCTTQQNGTQRTVRKVTTLRDQCGNVTGHLEETSTVSNGRTESPGEQLADISMPTFHEDNSTIPTLQQQQHLSGECIANTSAPGAMLLDSTMTGRVNQTVGNILAPSFGTNVCLENVGQGMQTMRQQQQQLPVNCLPNECLDNVTAPSSCECLEDVTAPSSLGHSRLASRRHQQRSQNICDVTAPSFAGSTRGATRLEDLSMPSFGGISGAARARSPSRQQRENICDITAPSFGNESIGDATMTTECLQDISMPTFGQVSGASRTRSPRRQQRSGRPAVMTNECLDNVTMPSFGGVSGSSRRQQTMPSECLENITQPSFGRSQSVANFLDMPSSYVNSRGAALSNEYLDNVTMPSFGGVSGSSRRHQTMPSECLEDMTQPSLGVSRRLAITNECLDNITMPSLNEVSGSLNRQQTMPSECLENITQPSFGSSRAVVDFLDMPSSGNSRAAAMTNECLDNVTMPSFGGVSGSSRRQQTMPSECLENITQPSFGRSQSVANFLDMPSSYVNSRGAALTNECLDNVTMPSFGGVSGSSRRHQTMPSECLEDMTQPSLGVSRRLAITNECLDNITMPSLNEVSGSLNRQQTMPSECLENITQPSFGSSRAVVDFLDMPSSGNSRAAAMTNECLDNVTMPSFGGVSGSSRRQRTMPSECLENITQPSFESSRGVDHFLDVPSTYGNSRGAALTNECSDNVTMPSFGGVSGSLRRQRTMPSECLENITQPSFGSSRAAAITNECLDNITMPSFNEVSSSLRRQQTMPSECLADVTQPSYGNSRSLAITSECLDNMTMPSFGGVSGSSRRQQTLPLEYLDNVTQPTFDDSRRQQQMYNQSRTGGRRQRTQNICDGTAPSFGSSSRGLDDFGGVSSASRTRSSRRRQRSAAPAFHSTGRGQLTNECLDNVTMPSFGGVSAASRRQQSLPSAWLNDVSQPSFGSSSLHGQTTRRQQQNMSNMRSMRTQECLDDMTMPSFGGISGISSRRMPSECLADVSAPSSFGGRSRSARRSPYHGEYFGNSTINPCLEDVSMPSFGGVSGASQARSPRRQQRSGRSAVMTNECLDNVTMPSFGGVSGSSRRQQTMPSECLENITQPSFGSSRSVDNFLDISTSYGNSRGAALTNEFLDNVTMPSFGGVSGSSRRHQTMPSECLEDITQPSFGESGRLALTNECLDNITMPSLGVSLRRQQTMPSECLENVTQPSFGSSRAAVGFAEMPPAYGNSRATVMPSECLDNVTMPSFGDSLRRQQTMPSECLENITQPSFGTSRAAALTSECLDNVTMPSFGGVSGSLRRQRTMPSECLENITQPSFGSSRAAALTNECLDNITMPSFNEVSASLRRQQTMPSECLENITQPSFIDGRSRVMTNECLDNMTAPSFGGVSGVSRRQQLLPSECLENVTQPSFDDMSYYVNDNADASVALGRRQTSRRQQRSQNICDVTAPSFASSTRGATRLEDLSMPSFGGISGASRVRSPSRRQRENICDITAPSFAPESVAMPSYAGRSQSQGATRRHMRDLCSEYLEDMTMPSYAMSQNTPQLWDITPPEWDYNSYASYSRRPRSVDDGNVMRSLQVSGFECLDDVTMPTMRRTRSFPCVPNSQQRLGNDNESTMNVLHFSYQSRQPIDADASYPSELLGNVSAPTYASNLSRPQRSDRSNMQNEKPTMLDSTSNQRPRNNFARSTAIGEEVATADSNEEPCQCPASQVDQTSSQIRQNASEKQASNQSIAKQEDGSAAKKEVTIIASVTSMTRIYMKKNDDSNYQNINDISMPSEYQSGANKTMFITNISEPSFTNLSATNPNYNATAQTSTTLPTPQPVRDNPNNARKCVANNRVEARPKCCCSNNCRRYRKSRQSTMKTRHNPDFK
ncbi:uncharacterized protein LOC133847734 isoform X2 [Drosophila sulfurigaster albostrigata]|uniref:uncharacterized protein LOC133847734 isoform X2 n=1 Tax=Drosophila sulfurigaster albostrigata TaxID=89887 RepID=UPI002D21E8DE|nr:uncharacterized protein LOC133847734 isoform X2 [Drosophila sulfurigaster albostrigata]